MKQSNDDSTAKKIALALHARENTSRAFGIKLEDAGEGWARASMTVQSDMLNGHGIGHGGIIFALADTAFAWACNSRNVKTVAQQASISFLSAAQKGEQLTAEAREECVSGRCGVYSVRVAAEDGRTIAIFQGLSRSIGGAVVVE
ncbi:MAG: hydroxyphenylacetyl-CoA thioesterase PaaI [Marinicaulis sp.]|nr:hydroxyphenylacetyl-CoA thioesterase PaaI [Marinicaulis sp.]NNL88094.1 hydroxyphenylacetyl-CoA thioesterase PaaI [Marinicaulis sp.]